MRHIFDRAFEIASATFPRAPQDGLAHPFGFDLHPAYRWRVSIDVWDALCAAADMPKRTPGPTALLLNEPLYVDDSLPPNSMLLEPVLDYLPGSLEIVIR